ncbi:oxidoreductase [Pseudoclavibacter endophyticus]|uniref:Pyridine nucleotide-disulfide oxidoreductase n=1 Tax=Pseudoclavibacter endophyticus TaxID=1778590 RepID=A0A6H9WQQ4_9MICO|nr:FAD-dependent oxidoreductase [Pseudoclavibacter endophyticus]KAB1648401.1 pyridine nucleotide-disulfide oxidoreductase [Pseudoclavibacter endophyticus]GGA72391.1 oxidoreductase [Pseudoclavibacter endophyticus]
MGVVIIGAGHAGVQAAESLRTEGYEGAITLLEKTPHLPYQRPPLSKDYMKAAGEPAPLPMRGEAFYAQHGIELRTGADVTGIDADTRLVRLADGEQLAYDDVIVAVGADARRASCEGVGLAGVEYLRTVDDAATLRAQLDAGHGRVVVVGAGFIGLEFAAVAAKRGLEVTVIDFAQRPMQRVLTPSMSEHFVRVHEGLGVTLRFNEGLDRFVGANGRVAGVVGTSGAHYPCDFAVVGLGVVTDEALAEGAGLGYDRGILVDEYLRSTVPHVYAIGDVAVFPSKRAGAPLRLESVQNATDMAKTVAKTVAGDPTEYDVAPWFWSNQGPAKLQIAGLADPADIVIERGDRETGKFSQFLFRDERLVAVESVNRPADHVASRKLLEHGATITMEQARDPEFDLKAYARALTQ